MFGIKTYLKKQPKNLLLSSSRYQFPEKPISFLSQKLFLSYFSKQLKDYSENIGIGSLNLKPNKIAVSAWQKFVPFVTNNLGNWSIKDEKPYNVATQLERNVISQMVDLYKGQPDNLEGYLTSGGTEGNIYSAWIGRKYLEQYTDKENICLLRNDLTHYSIKKSADIVGVQDFVIPLDEKKWSASIVGLSKLVIQLYKKGFRGFMIPITLGFTVGGTNDDLRGIINILNEVKGKYKDIHLFYWIDAALSGLTLPFTEKGFQPFRFSEIQTFIVDFHKFAGVPYPAGLMLYRQNLRKLIEKDIPYLKQKDNTLLGSRSGISAISIWLTIQSYGTGGFQKMVNECLSRKNNFINLVVKKFPDSKIISQKNSVSVAIIVRKPFPEKFCQKYGIEPIDYNIQLENFRKKFKIYKLFFLPKY